MKATLFALLVGLLVAGCEESSTPSDPVDSPKAIDLDDKETRDKIIAEAIDGNKLQNRGEKGEELLYAPNEQTPYTGWLKVMYENGQIKVLGQLKDGKPSRLTQWYENGQKGSEEINKAGKNVTARWYENGSKAERFTVINGQKHGLWTSWYENGLKKAEVNWENGEMHGLMTFWYDNGQKKEEGIFKNSLKDGPRTEWYENGQKKAEGNFKDGKVVSAVVWKPNGEKCPVTYVEDGAGVVVNYNENGTVENRLAFEFGEGTLQNESQTVLRELDIARVAAGGYRKAEKKVFTYKDGPATDWHKNGQKKSEGSYKDGKQDGLWTAWYDNGSKRVETTYKDGKQDGVVNAWYNNSLLKEKSTYSNGKIVSAFVWKPNGEKCPVTSVKNGNGVKLWYVLGSTQVDRITYKNGERVRN
jgi:antitoxin component YwqK of YwqJK toxin-antitoxin module